MPTHLEIRNAIATTLQTVPDIGQIHTRERYAKTTSGFRKLFGGGTKLRVWIIVRRRIEETSPAVGRRSVVMRWELRHYESWQDSEESELAFDTRIDAARAAFRTSENLGIAGVTTVVGTQAGAQVVDAGPVMFADALCHGARLALPTRHFE